MIFHSIQSNSFSPLRMDVLRCVLTACHHGHTGGVRGNVVYVADHSPNGRSDIGHLVSMRFVRPGTRRSGLQPHRPAFALFGVYVFFQRLASRKVNQKIGGLRAIT